MTAAFVFLAPASAQSASVFVQYGSIVEYGATYVAASQPGVFAQADAVGGSLRVTAFRDGSVAPEDRVEAGIYPIGITNPGLSPLALGPLTLDVSAAMSHTGTSDGAVIHTVEAGLSYGLNDLSAPYIIYFTQYTQLWSGGSTSYSEFPPTVTSGNGGAAEVAISNHDVFEARLVIPEFTLDPGETAWIYAFLNVRAQVYGDGHTGTTETTSPARLRLQVAPGALYTTNAGVPIAWIVPEPAFAALLGLAAGVVAARRYAAR